MLMMTMSGMMNHLVKVDLEQDLVPVEVHLEVAEECLMATMGLAEEEDVVAVAVSAA